MTISLSSDTNGSKAAVSNDGHGFAPEACCFMPRAGPTWGSSGMHDHAPRPLEARGWLSVRRASVEDHFWQETTGPRGVARVSGERLAERPFLHPRPQDLRGNEYDKEA